MLLTIATKAAPIAITETKILSSESHSFVGLERKVLERHIVNDKNKQKNLLYQSDFQEIKNGRTNDKENTVFVIKYDFELAENITR